MMDKIEERKKLKDMYSVVFIEELSQTVLKYDNTFDSAAFIQSIFSPSWDQLELKPRIRKIATCLFNCLGKPYAESIQVILKIGEEKQGFPYLFLPDIVELYGLNDWDISMNALEKLTQSSSSEFAIRPFLEIDYKKAMAQMKKWSKNSNEHVRRLSSEGIRIRLPWGKNVTQLSENPLDIIEILTNLSQDDSEYVRKSVANNLNDMSTKYPELVYNLFKEWLSYGNKNTDWIIKRAARTLIKNGNKDTLDLLGYKDNTRIKVSVLTFEVDQKVIQLGDSSNIHYQVGIDTVNPSNVKINLVIGFVKANGTISDKVFHLADKKITTSTVLEGNKKYSWVDMTTRKHHAGTHFLKLIVNGKEVDSTQLTLK